MTLFELLSQLAFNDVKEYVFIDSSKLFYKMIASDSFLSVAFELKLFTCPNSKTMRRK